jgi:diguanylate cyclase (GGDEF)-like protein
MEDLRAAEQVTRVTTLLAAVVAFTVAVIPPLAWYGIATEYHSGRLDAELRAKSFVIEQIIARNPVHWRWETERLTSILSDPVVTVHLDRHDIVDAAGEIVATAFDRLIDFQEDPLPKPLMHRSLPLLRSDAVVGEVHSTYSLRNLLYQTAAMAVLGLLLGAGTFFVFRFLPMRALRQSLNKVTYLANHDPLTGLPNRALFADRLERTIAHLDRSQDNAAVLFLDLDHFKDVNDTLGHAVGDLLLKQVCERLQFCLRKTDTLARFGGDEFAIIQVGLEQSDAAAMLAQRLTNALRHPFDLDGHEVTIGLSVGIALLDGSTQVPGDLLRQADLALYRAKQDGRGTFRFFEEEMNERLLERKALERDLRRAVDEEQFELHYQPQIDLRTGSVTGVEALLRWRHPTRGLVSPANFVPLAEETGLIMTIGEWALRRACTEARGWATLQLGVNLSPAQFRNPGLSGMIARVLAETGFAPHRLELEITEGLLLRDTDATLATLQTIRAQGVRIVMDDFGTGYSSLSYLRKFPFDKVKIDGSFIRDLETSENATAIVRAVIALCHTLGMRANAEGVESLVQANRLLAEGCQEVQGFHFGRPLPASELWACIGASGRPAPGPSAERAA